jgi:hypothetical protein
MTPEDLGLLPDFLSDRDPRPAAAQIDQNYAHGGGWRPQQGFTLLPSKTLTYPGDPPLQPVAMTRLRDETLLFYPHAILAIVQPDGAFEVCRVD